MSCKKSVVVFLTTFVLVGCGYRDPDDYTRRIQQHLPSEWQARAFFDTSSTYEGKTLVVEARSRQNGMDFKVLVWRSPRTGKSHVVQYLNDQPYYSSGSYDKRYPIPPFDIDWKVTDGANKVLAARDAVGW